ncbi:hypothetical protein MYO4S_00034 [Serratia phage 4S]|nr:hypothetical protein MYO4S_00034 [Serratia phage 4S]
MIYIKISQVDALIKAVSWTAQTNQVQTSLNLTKDIANPDFVSIEVVQDGVPVMFDDLINSLLRATY